MESFGQRLKSLRREAGFSQSDLSDRIGVSIQSISKWENDNTMPDISQIVPLAAVLGVSTDWLLGVGINEKADKAAMEKKVDGIMRSKSTNTYEENADFLAYQAEDDFLKKYPLNYGIRLECAEHLFNFIFRSTQHYYNIPQEHFDELQIAGVKMLQALMNQDKNPSRQIDGRKLLIKFHMLKSDWEEAEKVAMELPESYEIRDEALYDIANEKKDYATAEELAYRVSKKRAYEYLHSLFLRARRISIYGDKESLKQSKLGKT